MDTTATIENGKLSDSLNQLVGKLPDELQEYIGKRLLSEINIPAGKIYEDYEDFEEKGIGWSVGPFSGEDSDVSFVEIQCELNHYEEDIYWVVKVFAETDEDVKIEIGSSIASVSKKDDEYSLEQFKKEEFLHLIALLGIEQEHDDIVETLEQEGGAYIKHEYEAGEVKEVMFIKRSLLNRLFDGTNKAVFEKAKA